MKLVVRILCIKGGGFMQETSSNPTAKICAVLEISDYCHLPDSEREKIILSELDKSYPRKSPTAIVEFYKEALYGG